MKKDPVDHLLMSLYHQYGWGNPYEGINGNISDIKYMQEMGMLRRNTYISRPVIESNNDDCQYKFMDKNRDDLWPNNLFDLLGEYRVDKFNQSGKIYLWENCIRNVGRRFYDDYGKILRKGRQYCINLFREIVLWHELGHWIIHWMPGNDRHRWNTSSFQYNNKTKDVHEGLAQAFTQYAIINIEEPQLRNEYQQVFHYLLRNQEACYHKHYDIISHSKFSWAAMLGGITMLRILEDPQEVTFEYLLNNMFP